jgi:hypothetical protein
MLSPFASLRVNSAKHLFSLLSTAGEKRTAVILRHENGCAEGTLECPSVDGHSKAIRAFSCIVVSRGIMKSSLRMTAV